MKPVIKDLLLLTGLLSVLSFNAAGQNSLAPGAGLDSTEAIIEKIRKEYAQINSDSAHYRLDQRNIFGESTEGGEIVRHLAGKELRKLVATFYGETGKRRMEYYFADGKLFFCYDRHWKYNKPMYVEGSHVSRIEENRYYLENLQLIRWLGSNGKMADKKLYPAKKKALLEELKRLEGLKEEQE